MMLYCYLVAKRKGNDKKAAKLQKLVLSHKRKLDKETKLASLAENNKSHLGPRRKPFMHRKLKHQNMELCHKENPHMKKP